MTQLSHYVAAVLLGVTVWLPEPAGAQVPDSSAFLAWWDRTLWTRTHLFPPAGVEREDHVYTSLPTYTGSIDLTSIDARADSLEVRVLHQAAAATWLLVVPWIRLDRVEDLEGCVYKSWLVSTAGGAPFELAFFPYCAQTYGADEEFTLYRLSAGALPWIELGTNGPACIPVFLIRFDEVAERFVLERDECGG